MYIKNKQKIPNTVTDLFAKLDLPEAAEANLKLDKKSLNALIKEMSLQESSNISELHQIKTHLKKIREINIHAQIEFEYLDKFYSYNFLNVRGSFIPEYLLKEIYACNFLDAKIMSIGELNSKDKIIQLFTAIVLVHSAFIKSIIGKVINPTMTIQEGIQLCEGTIDLDKKNYQNLILSIFDKLREAINTYEELEVLDSFIEDPKIEEKILKLDSELIDLIKTKRESTYIKARNHLEQAINMCITQEFFKEYQRSSILKKPKILCQGHSLLNNRLLLRNLNGSALNTEGNLQKKHNYKALDQRILELLEQDKFKKKFKNKSIAAEKIANEIANEIEGFMEYDRINNHHNQCIKIENLPQKILKLINQNPEIKAHLLHK